MPQELEKFKEDILGILKDHVQDYTEGRDLYIDLIRRTTEDTVRYTVNGKIDKLTNEVKELSLRADPVLTAFERSTVVSKFFVWSAKAIGVVGAVIIACLGAWETIINIATNFRK